jgi:hypothetical protein
VSVEAADGEVVAEPLCVPARGMRCAEAVLDADGDATFCAGAGVVLGVVVDLEALRCEVE